MNGYRIGIAGFDVRSVKMLMTVVKESHFEEGFKKAGSGFNVGGQRSRGFSQVANVTGDSADVNFSILHQLTLPVCDNNDTMLKKP